MNPSPSLESVRPASSFCWQVPGKPILVLLAHEVVDRLSREALEGLEAVPRRGVEIGGLLLGTAQRGEKLVVRVEDYCPVPCEYFFGPSYILSEGDKQTFEQGLEQWSPSPARALYLVGYYRSHTRDDPWLGEADLRLISSYFADPAKVTLVIKPRAGGKSVAGFFFWEAGHIRGNSTYLEFPFDRRALGGPEPAPAAPEAAPASSAEPVAEPLRVEAEVRRVEAQPERPAPGSDLVPLPSFLAVTQPEAAPSGLSRRRLKSLWVRIALVSVLVPLGSWLGWMGARQYHRLLPRVVGGDPFSLELAVVEYGDNLHLTWNRDAPAIQLGERGILVIADGDQNRSLELDEAQLRNGTVIYRRMAGPVRFRLEVILRGGNRSVSESWEAKPPPTPGQSSH